MSPPTDSTASAISTARRAGVPLNKRCSRKWLAPARRSGLSREPVPTQKPTATDRSAGRRSVTTRTPESRRARRIPEASSPIAAVIDAPTLVIEMRRSATPPTGAAAVAASFSAPVTGPLAAAPALARRLGRPEVAELGAGLRVPELVERRHLVGGSARSLAAPPVPAIARGAVTARRAATAGVAVARGLRVAHVVGERQRELALVVDVVDAHGDLVAEVHDVLHPVDALAPTELRDVQQAVAAREHVHERAELRDVDDASRVLRAELGRRRVEDELDAPPRLLHLFAVRRTDRDQADHAVVAHRDIGTGFLAARVDQPALRADPLTDLVHRDPEADQLRRGL